MRRPVERHGRGRGDLFAALAGLLVLGHLQLRRRQRHLRTVFGDQVGGRHAELFEHLGFQLLDPQRRLGFGDLIPMQRVGQRVDLGAELVGFLTSLGQRRDPELTFSGQLVTRARGNRHDRAEPLRDKASRLGHRRGHRGSVFTCFPGPLRAQAGLPLGGRGAAQRIRPAPNGIRAFLGRAHREPGLDLDTARGFGRRHRGLPVHRLGLEHRHLLGAAQAGFELGELLDGLGASRFELVTLLDQLLEFLFGRPCVLAEPAQVLVDRRNRRVGFVERSERLLGRVLPVGLLGQRTRERGPQFTGLFLRGLQFGARLVDLRRDLQSGGLAVRAAAYPAGTDEITVCGHRAQARVRRDQLQPGRHVADDRHICQHRRDGSAQPVRDRDQLGGPQRTVGQHLRTRGVRRRPVAEQDRRAAPVGFLERGDRRGGRAEVLGRNRVRGGAQHCRDGHLIAGADLEQLCDRTEKPCVASVLLQPRRSVTAVQADRERLDAGPERRHLAFCGTLGGLQLGDTLVGEPQCRHRAVVVLVEAHFTGVEFTDPALYGLEFCFRVFDFRR